jgi:hypothetical protein
VCFKKGVSRQMPPPPPNLKKSKKNLTSTLSLFLTAPTR